MSLTKRRRGFTDRRARLLHAHAVVVAVVASPFLVLVASYSITAPELGLYGRVVAWAVACLAAISVACIVAAYRLQLSVERQQEAVAAAATSAAAGWSQGPVEPDPGPPPAPAPAPVRPTPISPAPARAAAPPVVAAPAPAPAPARAEVIVGEVVEPAAPTPRAPLSPALPEPAPIRVEVTEPAHH